MDQRGGESGLSPFIVYALPRSRTVWLSHFLSGPGAVHPCGHDVGVRINTLSDLREVLTKTLSGTVETGSMMGWRWARKTFPEARFVVVRRPIDEVAASLDRIGLNVSRSVLLLRDAWLDEIARQSGTLSFATNSLDDPDTCRTLFRWCHGRDCSDAWLNANVGINIQLDLSQRIELLSARAAEIEGLKAEAELADRALRDQALPFVEFRSEGWSERIEQESAALAKSHFDEVDHGVEDRRPFRLDCDIMRRIDAAGLLQLNTARVNGALAAYCIWTIGPDPESVGLTVANQGPWFAEDRSEYRGLNLGTTLFRRSLDDLRTRGVQCVFPHHRTQGRGAGLGAFFRRMGAKEIQRGYSLWIGT